MQGEVVLLSAGQVTHAFLERRVAGRYAEFTHRIERLAGSVGVARQIGSLPPATVLTLLRGQGPQSLEPGALRKTSPLETQQLHVEVFGRLHRSRRKPRRGTLDTPPGLRLAAGRSLFRNRANRRCRPAVIAIAGGRTRDAAEVPI